MKKWLVTAITVLCCGIMLFVDGIWQPGYLVKSGIKAVLFLGLPLLAVRWLPYVDAKALFKPKKQSIFPALAMGVGVYVLIVGGFFLLRPFVDFSGIAENLSSNAGVTRDNFLWVSLYISFVNSLLEEFFFRGFVVRGLGNTRFAWIFSALTFSLYHTAMMAGWFAPWLFVLALIGLAVGGLLFTWLDSGQGTLYPSWLMHMFANFAINTVGFILL